jgi:hypothetical protein
MMRKPFCRFSNWSLKFNYRLESIDIFCSTRNNFVGYQLFLYFPISYISSILTYDVGLNPIWLYVPLASVRLVLGDKSGFYWPMGPSIPKPRLRHAGTQAHHKEPGKIASVFTPNKFYIHHHRSIHSCCHTNHCMINNHWADFHRYSLNRLAKFDLCRNHSPAMRRCCMPSTR